MPTPNPQSYPASSTYPQYPQDPQYPHSDSKSSTSYTGYPGGQPQPDSYNPYNKYDSTSTSSTTATAPKKSGFLSKLGLNSGKPGKPDKSSKPNKPNKPNKYTPPAASYVPPALGTAAALGALSHHKHGKKHGLGLGGGMGLGLGGAVSIRNFSLFLNKKVYLIINYNFFFNRPLVYWLVMLYLEDTKDSDLEVVITVGEVVIGEVVVGKIIYWFYSIPIIISFHYPHS